MITELKNNIPAFHAKTRKDWRNWLQKNHAAEKSVWLIIYHKDSKTPSIYYDEAVEECLCFGWIDSKPNKRDGESYYLYCSQRKPASNWSGINKVRAEKMIQQKQMGKAGMAMINLAKETGTWDALRDVESFNIPPDMQSKFDKNKIAQKNFLAFPPSAKRGILEWILNAKRPETRLKRIMETVNLAAKNIKANQYNPRS